MVLPLDRPLDSSYRCRGNIDDDDDDDSDEDDGD